MSKNFSAPRSAPKPASVSTMSASERPSRVATSELQPWAMLPNGPPCTSAGPPSRVCTRLGRIASLSSRVIAPAALRSAGGHRLLVAGEADDDPAETAARGRRDPSARQRIAMTSLPGTMTKRSSRVGPPLMPAQPDHDLAQGAIVHVDGAGPGDAAGVEAERVAVMEMVVEQRGEQVVRRGDRVKIPGEMQVDLVHRHDLGVAAAGRAALHPEHRAERRLADADHHLLAQPAERLRQADGDGATSLPRRASD